MCLIAFAIGARAHCPLLIASNRDEFFDRPTKRLHRWNLPGGTTVLAGRDGRDGGTWLGLNEHGRVALLTNVRSARAAPGARSRGELPTRWLAGDLEVRELAASIDPAAYGGFNLVVGDARTGTWAWLSNRHPATPHQEPEHAAPALHQSPLGPGVYGVSNATLDTPWPKTERLKAALTEALDRSTCSAQSAGPESLAPLTSALAQCEPAPEHLQAPTGVPADIERALSSPFVRLPQRGYGTRSSLVVQATPLADLAATGWRLNITEWAHTPPTPGTPHAWQEASRVQHTVDWVF